MKSLYKAAFRVSRVNFTIVSTLQSFEVVKNNTGWGTRFSCFNGRIRYSLVKNRLFCALEDVSTDLQKKSDEIGIQELRKKYGDS